MTDVTIKAAFWDYDRTRPLIDGRVKPTGFSLEPVILRPREAFTRMLEREEFDVAEVSLASFVRLKANNDDRFIGIPVTLSKMFRHSCIYVRPDAKITRPEDLRRRRIGASQLDSTGIVFIKGMLCHDFGVHPDDIDWVVGGLESPTEPLQHFPAGHGAVRNAARGETLVSLIESGQIDAILSNHIPSNFRAGSPHIRRLFQDYKTVEVEYFRRTGLFPVMHVVAIKSEVFHKNHSVANNLYNAFCNARDLALDGLHDTDALRLSLPWLIAHVEETKQVLGDDIWRYGVEANRPAFDAINAYLVEQQLSPRRVPIETLFATVHREAGRRD